MFIEAVVVVVIKALDVFFIGNIFGVVFGIVVGFIVLVVLVNAWVSVKPADWYLAIYVIFVNLKVAGHKFKGFFLFYQNVLWHKNFFSLKCDYIVLMKSNSNSTFL